MKKRKNYLKLSARILAIVFVLFVGLFTLEVFGEYAFPEILVALFMHLVPSLVLLVLLLIAWRGEKVGGILYLVLGVVFVLFFDLYESLIGFLLIGLPVFVVGVLFLLSRRYSR